MYLQKLEIQGFKSFANKTTLEFNRQLTAIVGPNGSGKSNIADAIRWVLGEQSLKLLRGKRAEDVIFAGSDLKSRLGMAEASLYLNNEDGSAQVDFSEIVVTRRVFRDGQSEYLLNQSPVRLQDIQLLLAQANFGQKTYSVIGQGMIDSILLSSPADRKEFFEEATGVKQYQLKREQAIQKLTTTYENLEQAEALLREIEPRLRALTRQVKRLERREELEKELREIQKGYFRYRFQSLKTRHDGLFEQTTKLTNELEKQRALSAELGNKLKKLEGADVIAERWKDLQTKQAELRHKLSELLREQARYEAQTEVEHLKRGEGELALLKQRLIELDTEAKRLTVKTRELEQEEVKLRQTLERKLVEQTKVVAEFDQLAVDDGNTWLESELQGLLSEQAEFRRRLMGAKSLIEVGEITKQVASFEEHLRRLLKRVQQKGKMSTAGLNELLKTRDTLVNEVALLEAGLKGLARYKNDISSRQEEIAESKSKIEQKLNTSSNTKNITSEHNIEHSIIKAETELAKVEEELSSFHIKSEARKTEFFALQRELTQATSVERKLEQESHELALELARLETKLEDLEREMAQEVPPEMIHTIKEPGKVEAIDEGNTALELQKLKHQLELTGGIEPEVVTEYQQTKTRYDFLSTQSEDLHKAIASLESVIRDLDETIDKKFMVSFKAINEKFVKYFQVLFVGGRAQLILQKGEVMEEENELVEGGVGLEGEEPKQQPSAKERFLKQEKLRASIFSGVEIQATPPGKKLSSITALSGGEKALTSIALICAIISNNPSPFVTLDEVDAALDEANSERFAAILDSLINETQFIAITHNRATMKRASILYGVTMGEDGVSRLLSVKLDEARAMVT